MTGVTTVEADLTQLLGCSANIHTWGSLLIPVSRSLLHNLDLTFGDSRIEIDSGLIDNNEAISM